MHPLRPLTISRDLRQSAGVAAPLKIHSKTRHSKTRTGCRVCKIRRIKCDETKPACTRCTSTGRKCEGYPDLTSKTTDSLSCYRISAETTGDFSEQRSFCYLRARAIYDISGYFESEFWNRLVLQISQREPAVRHALIALGTLCETCESQNLKRDKGTSCNQLALQHYNKAVRLMAGYMSSPQPQLEVVLTSCLVFVWLEFVQNDFDAGMNHLEGGLKILDNFRQPNKPPASTPQYIDASLIYMFCQLKTQATVYGKAATGFVFENSQEVRQAVPASFASIEQARNSLHILMGNVFQFVRQIHDPNVVESMTKSHPWPDPLSLEATRRSHLIKFRDWHRATKNSPALTFKSPNLRQTTAMCLLHMYHKTVTILLETLFTQSQMIYDQYESSFDEILVLAEQLISTSQHEGFLVFFDMGVMAPLFYVVLKCHNLRLWRKALSLLRVAPHQEGIWHRQDVVEYAEWKIHIEERGRKQLSESDALPEEARVSNERMEAVLIDGRPRTVVSFQWRYNGRVVYGKSITDLKTRMGQLL